VCWIDQMGCKIYPVQHAIGNAILGFKKSKVNVTRHKMLIILERALTVGFLNLVDMLPNSTIY